MYRHMFPRNIVATTFGAIELNKAAKRRVKATYSERQKEFCLARRELVKRLPNQFAERMSSCIQLSYVIGSMSQHNELFPNNSTNINTLAIEPIFYLFSVFSPNNFANKFCLVGHANKTSVFYNYYDYYYYHTNPFVQIHRIERLANEWIAQPSKWTWMRWNWIENEKF